MIHLNRHEAWDSAGHSLGTIWSQGLTLSLFCAGTDNNDITLASFFVSSRPNPHSPTPVGKFSIRQAAEEELTQRCHGRWLRPPSP